MSQSERTTKRGGSEPGQNGLTSAGPEARPGLTAQLRGKPLAEQEALLAPAGGGVQPVSAGVSPVQLKGGLDQLAGDAPVKEKDAPASVTLPEAVTEGMQSAWDKSLPGDASQEHGGNIVRNKDGSYGFRPGPPGTSGYYTPDRGDVGTDQTLVGMGHTHPYSKKEGGHTGVSFSGGDLSSIVWEKHNVEMVQSGKTLFLFARTEEFDKRLAGLDAAGKQELADEIEETWDTSFQAMIAKEGIVKAAEAATKVTCAKYNLLYYKGEGAKLDRVDVSK